MRRARTTTIGAAIALCALLGGCAADSPAADTAPSTGYALTADGYSRELHAELVRMAGRDQAGRSGGIDDEGDFERKQRLREIIAEVGWPTITMVGDDGADAAWLIAQHADFDVAFQARALALLTAAAMADEASWGNVAYLSDRVAVNLGRAQRFGTQIDCGRRGAVPRYGLVSRRHVDEWRHRFDLASLESYLSFMDEACAG